jgi:hypothetical protein
VKKAVPEKKVRVIAKREALAAVARHVRAKPPKGHGMRGK